MLEEARSPLIVNGLPSTSEAKNTGGYYGRSARWLLTLYIYYITRFLLSSRAIAIPLQQLLIQQYWYSYTRVRC